MRAIRVAMYLLSVVMCVVAQAATINVKADGTGDYPTIQAAVDAASAGDEVVLQPGTYIGSNNRDISFGGKAIAVRSTNPKDPAVVAATVIDCQRAGRGFAFHIGEGASSILRGLTIANGSSSAGGAISCSYAGPTIEYCIVRDCYTEGDGGAICCNGGSPMIRNCVFTGNTGIAYASSGGILCFLDGGTPSIVSCAVLGNRGWVFGQNYSGDYPAVTVRNCILWDNDGVEGYGLTLSISYSVVEGGYAGTGNADTDPKLRPDGLLRWDSPCINAGDPAYVPASGETDIQGETRVSGGRVDIGPDEFVDSDGDGLPDWWETKYFGSATAGVATADADGNGKSNLEEYNQGTYPLAASVFYVDPAGGSDGWDGVAQAWDGVHGPKRTIQAAIDETDSGNQVVLLPGIYTGNGNRDVSFRGKAITVRSTNPKDPAVVAATVIDCQGDWDNYHRGFLFANGETSTSLLSGLTIRRGSSPGGGGVRCDGTSPTIQYCHFTDSFSAGGAAGSPGGAIHCSNGQPAVLCCRFTDNEAAVACHMANAQFLACTFAGDEGNWVLYAEDCSPTVRHCIFWGNEGTSIETLYGAVDLSYSIVEGGYSGSGNLDVNPRLRSDGTLLPDSPCINAGDPSYTPASGETDMQGEARIAGGRVDIGPDEFVDTDGDGLPDWWEVRYFGSSTAGAANGDSDGDGNTNIEEYNYGSDPLAAAATYYVNPAQGDDTWDGLAAAWDGTHGPKKTIQAAVDAAPALDGCHIVLAAGTYSGPGNRGINLGGKVLTVQSTNPADPAVVAATVMDGLGLAPGFTLTSNSALKGVTLTNIYDADYSAYGAVRCNGDNVRVVNCVITGSLCHGVYIEYGCDSVEISGCKITQSTSDGVFVEGRDLTVSNSVICGNAGYGMREYSNPHLTISNSTITNNAEGTEIYGEAVVRNSIIWEPAGFWCSYEKVNASCSVFHNGMPGTGNLSVDPKLRTDGHLRSDSPCRNAGDPGYAAGANERDIDREARVAGGRVDIGADEFTDGDVDDLPDWWEAKYFGSAMAAEASADPDGDSWSNLEEYNRGTNPQQASPSCKYYVDPVNGNDSWDGQAASYDGTHGPKRTIQAAIDAVPAGEEGTVTLAAGTYAGSGNRDIDLKGKPLIVKSTNPDDPAVVAATVIDCQGSESNPHRGFVFQTDEGPETVLAGVTIINGYAPYDVSSYDGGAIVCSNAGPTIRNCVMRQCHADDNGGAIHCQNSSPIIQGCIFRDNYAENCGGAVCCQGSDMTIENCMFLRNSSWASGGAILVDNGSLVATGCSFVGNSCGNSSRGAISHYDTAISLRNSLFHQNGSSPIEGYGSTVSATHCLGTGLTGTGNIEVDPKITPDGHLRSDSPCVNTGEPAYAPAGGATDMDRENRLAAGRIDIGADEWHDSDGDSLPDWWETKYFGSATAGQAAADTDGDGADNLAEYNRGTNPLTTTPTYYVDPVAGDDTWDGRTAAWDGNHGPKKTIQAAFNEASVLEGARVILLPGTYMGDGNRDIDFVGKPVVVEAMVSGSAIVDCQGSQSDKHRAFVLRSGEGSSSGLIGLTIVNGYAPSLSFGSSSYPSSGGAVACAGSTPTIRNCVFRANRSDDRGGAIFCINASPTVESCTFVGNTASDGSAVYVYSGSPVLRQCAIAGADQLGGGSYAMSYCVGQEVTGGTGNLTADPRLTPDGHLTADSPCIDAGDPAYSPVAGEKDMDAEARVRGARIDIGADEWHDSDNDALPDWWETRYFGSATAGIAAGDPDGDQADNLKEYRRGSDPLAASATYYVDPAAGDDTYDGLARIFDGAHGPKKTIQAAINAAPASDGSRVVLLAGTYTGDGNRDIDFGGKMLTVQSEDPDDPAVVSATVIDSQGTSEAEHRSFYFHSGETSESELAGLTIQGGYARGGGGVYCRDSSPTIRRCVITGNFSYASSGGLFGSSYGGSGIGWSGGDGHVVDCTISGNMGSAGVCFSGNRLVLSGCVICDNNTTMEIAGLLSGIEGGGGLFCAGWEVSITDCIVSGNRSIGCGGGAVIEAANLLVSKCTIRDNATLLTAIGDTPLNLGGGLLVFALPLEYGISDEPLVIADCTIESNLSEYGGGVAVITPMGAGAYYQPLELRNCRIAGNYGQYGGGVYTLYSGMEFSGCTFSDNIAEMGGALAAEAAEGVVLDGCTLSNNQADSEGAAIYGYDSIFAVRTSRLEGNWATRGGAVSVAGGSLDVLNSCLADNVAASSGGAIHCASGAAVTVLNCTLADNISGYRGGAIACVAASPSVANSIIWGNGISPVHGGSPTVQYSLVEGGFSGVGNLNADPLLTGDYHLKANSPCVNAGDPMCTPASNETDIDGEARIASGRIDMGCDEVSLPSQPGDVNGDGYVNVGDLQLLVAAWGSASGGATWNANADFNADSFINVGDLQILVANWGRHL